MATKSKATRYGSVICKIGDYHIRHKVIQPKEVRSFKGEKVIKEGSTTSGIYLGRDLFKGGFNDHKKAIQYMWNYFKNSNLQHTVSKKVISKYNLV